MGTWQPRLPLRCVGTNYSYVHNILGTYVRSKWGQVGGSPPVETGLIPQQPPQNIRSPHNLNSHLSRVRIPGNTHDQTKGTGSSLAFFLLYQNPRNPFYLVRSVAAYQAKRVIFLSAHRDTELPHYHRQTVSQPTATQNENDDDDGDDNDHHHHHTNFKKGCLSLQPRTDRPSPAWRTIASTRFVLSLSFSLPPPFPPSSYLPRPYMNHRTYEKSPHVDGEGKYTGRLREGAAGRGLPPE